MSAPTASPPSTRLICHCRKVSYARVEEAIGAGARSVADVQRTTTACTHCFGCRFEVEGLLKEQLGEGYERAPLATRVEEPGAPSGLRGRIARALGRAEPPAPPKRMYLPILHGLRGDVTTRVALFHWSEEPAAPVSFRADLMALDGTRLGVHEDEVPVGHTAVVDTARMIEEAGGLPDGAATMKVVLDADRVMSLRPYFHFITPAAITSTHEKGAPRFGRLSKARTYHWIFPSGYGQRPEEAYFFLTNTLLDPLREHALVWQSADTGEEVRIPLETLEIDQTACVALHEHVPALLDGSEAGTIRLSEPSHCAGFIIRYDPGGDLWRVQHL